MSSEVFWVFEITLKLGAVDQFTALAKEMADANAAGEPGTLDYQVCMTADGARVHFCERFVDSAAVLVHVARFGQTFAGRVLEMAAVTRFEIYGEPSDEVKATLAGFDPTYLTCVAGFTR
jgi:quinol monooxygenase YgiN